MSPEQSPRDRNLRERPFREIAISQLSAMNILTHQTRQVVATNLWNTVYPKTPYNPANPDAMDKYESLYQWAAQVVPWGGRSMKDFDVRVTYGKLGNQTFKELSLLHARHLQEGFGSQQARGQMGSGRFWMGYIFDLMDLVTPLAPRTSKKMGIVVESLREAGVAPHMVGYVVDEMTHPNLTDDANNIVDLTPSELMLDTEHAAQLKDMYLADPLTTAQDIRLFHLGEHEGRHSRHIAQNRLSYN